MGACLALLLLSPALSSLGGSPASLVPGHQDRSRGGLQQLPTKDSTLLITPADPCEQNSKAQRMLTGVSRMCLRVVLGQIAEEL